MSDPPARTVRLVFLGDISAVGSQTQPEVHASLKAVIASADLVVANCESPIVMMPYTPLATRLGLCHAMMPGFLDDVIAAAGIDPARLVLSLANNHALDQGIAGFEETLSVLATRGITVLGVAAQGPVTRVSAGPLTVGLLAFTQWRNQPDFYGRVTMLDDIAGWRGADNGDVDMLCAIPHWDWEFRHFPRDETRALASDLLQRGVTLIAGHHAHVLQPLERKGNALVAYGLGDFLGTALPHQPWPGCISALLAVDISLDPATVGRIASYRLHPFMRIRQGEREKLVPVETLDENPGGKVRTRLAAIFGEAV